MHNIPRKSSAFQDGQYKQIVVQNLDEPENSWDRM